MADKPKTKSFQLTGTESITPEALRGLLGLLLFGGVIAFYFLGGLDWFTAREVDSLYVRPAEDLESQYRLMGSESSEMDKCVQAGIVAQAWLQAEDQGNYRTWKATEKSHCEAAGIEN